MRNSHNDNENTDLGDPDLQFGQNILDRLDAIRDDIEHAGVKGTISLIQAAIVRNHFDKQELISFGERVCPRGHFPVFRDVVDHFLGRDRKRHIWKLTSSGALALVA